MLKELLRQDKNGWAGRMFSFCPPFFLGLQDSLNPCGLASLIIFLAFLAVVAKTRKRLIWCGLVFILMAALTRAFFVLGGLDTLLNQSFIFNMIRWLYLGLGVLFIFCGFGHFKDWLNYKRNQKMESFIFKVPAYFQENFGLKTEASRRRVKIKIFLLSIGLFLLSAVMGFFIEIMESLLAQDYVLFINLMTHGQTKISLIFSLFLFSFSSLLSIVGVWLMMIWIFSSQKVRKSFLGSISFIKIVSSAILLSSGFGLMYSFLK